MKYLKLINILTFISIFSYHNIILNAQNTVKISAVKANNYGVSYSLPKTQITIEVTAIKTTQTKGEFYEYSQQYLNISNPIMENKTNFSIIEINETTLGIPDKERSYLVEFKNGTVAPYVTLTKNGLICAINSDSSIEETIPSNLNSKINDKTEKRTDAYLFLNEETLQADSKAKRADLISKQILKLRETKTNILTGEADNMPPDGNAYKLVIEQIDEQEKALTSLFIGSEINEYITKSYTVIPEDKDIFQKIIFRFSSKLGFLNNNDLAGQPVYLSLKSKEPKIEDFILSPKEEKELERKFSQGIIYNIPEKAILNVEYANKIWINNIIDVVQYGTQEVLIPKIFDNNKQPVKVIFYKDLGSIKQIIQ